MGDGTSISQVQYLEMILIFCFLFFKVLSPRDGASNFGDGTPISQVQSLGDGTYVLQV